MNAPLKDLMKTLLQDATRLTQTGNLQEATQAIQRALAGNSAPKRNPQSADQNASDPMIIDGCVVEIGSATSGADGEPVVQEDAFIAGSFSNTAGTRRYKLYVPPGHAGKTLPLVLMLHGCTQNPDDFAAGTGMNVLAREHGFWVLYPEQAQRANTSGCWNWFKHNHQARGRGEPALLAGMTKAVMAERGIDPQRVYVAGLSAGGAMAAVVAGVYPDLYAAAGVHSGLPVGAARDMMSALALMKDGQLTQPSTSPPRDAATQPNAVPTIVFHGDADSTVHPRNGKQVIAAVTHRNDPHQVLEGQMQHGRRYSQHIYRHDDDANSTVCAEHWIVHGSGHAWSGGHATGSYVDPIGPNASAEMLRFFLAHPRLANAA